MKKNKRFSKEWFQLRGTLIAPANAIGPIIHVEKFDHKCIILFQDSTWEVKYLGERKNPFRHIKFKAQGV